MAIKKEVEWKPELDLVNKTRSKIKAQINDGQDIGEYFSKMEREGLLGSLMGDQGFKNVYDQYKSGSLSNIGINQALSREALKGQGITDFNLTPQELADFKYAADNSLISPLEDYENKFLGGYQNLPASSFNAYTGRTYDSTTGDIFDNNGIKVPGISGGKENTFAPQTITPQAPAPMQTAGAPAQTGPKYGDTLTLPNGQQISLQDPNYSTFAKQLGVQATPDVAGTPQAQQANLGRKISNVEELNKLAQMGLTENDIVRYQGSIYLKPESKFSVGGTGVQTPAPTTSKPATDLKKLVNDQAAQMGNNVKANASYINGVFKAYFNRDATAAELKKYTGMGVQQALDAITKSAPSAGESMLDKGLTPEEDLVNFELGLKGVPNIAEGTEYGDITDAYNKALQMLNKPMTETQNSILNALTSMPSQVETLKKLKEEFGVNALMDELKKISEAATPLEEALRKLPQDVANRYQDIGLSEAQRRRRVALEAEPLTQSLADVDARTKNIQNLLNQSNDLVKEMAAAVGADQEKNLDVLKQQYSFLQDNIAQEKEQLDKQFELVVNSIDEARKNGTTPVSVTPNNPSAGSLTTPAVGTKGGQCGVWAFRQYESIANGVGMGNTLAEKTAWVSKYGTRGTNGIQVGDLVITDASDATRNGKPTGYGHALIVSGFDANGNIIAYESNLKGDEMVTNGRVIPLNSKAIVGYVRGKLKSGTQVQATSSPRNITEDVTKKLKTYPDAYQKWVDQRYDKMDFMPTTLSELEKDYQMWIKNDRPNWAESEKLEKRLVALKTNKDNGYTREEMKDEGYSDEELDQIYGKEEQKEGVWNKLLNFIRL